MRVTVAISALAVLAACSGPAMEPVRGAGFGTPGDLTAERAARESALAGDPIEIPVGPVISDETPGAGGQIALDNPGISDEQDFDAVAARETIESDAERRARQRDAYEIIAPTALPERPGAATPNIVDYALATTNAPGEALYRRSGFNAETRFQRNCAGYASADQAQQDFLARGGPERDRRGLDPDGDGFACYWDPTPFRIARDQARGGR